MKLVLDTNVVLDLFVFRDEAVRGLHEALHAGEVQWLATLAMREELACVLAYANLLSRMDAAGVTAAQVLEAFDANARVVEAAERAAVLCRDGDDQKFIDLALAQGCLLLSKDKRVLALDGRMRRLGAGSVKPATAHRISFERRSMS